MKTEVIDLCCQALCIEDATHAMYWPGRGHQLVCELHKRKAEEVAEAMGFQLTIERFERRHPNMKHEPVTPKHHHDEPAPPKEPPAPKGIDHILAELRDALERSPDRRALAVTALGAVVRMAADAGWHEQELASLRVWPK